MDSKTPLPFGLWPSSISAGLCATFPEGPSSAISQPLSTGDAIYWLSARPAEGGRNAIMRWDFGGRPEEILAAPWDARTRVHEYGGGAYLPTAHGVVFSHYADNRLYILEEGSTPRPLTTIGPYRYADLTWDIARNRIICVREDTENTGTDNLGPRADIVAIGIGSGEVAILVSGWDFYSNPQVSPDATELCWLCWNHPDMPWDSTTLCRARFKPDGSLGDHQAEVSEGEQSRLQPRWSPSGDLYFLGDRDDWWNVYRWSRQSVAKQITTIKGEVGAPPWLLGDNHWRFVDEKTIVLIYTSAGYWHAARADALSGEIINVSAPHAYLESVVTADGRAFVTGGDEHGRSGLYEYADGKLALAIPAGDSTLENIIDTLSVAQPLTIKPNGDSAEDICHCWFYPPTNPNYSPLPGEKPPAIIEFHGGPTAASWSMLKLSRQFWTSRGFAVLDVNYRGSSGRGRKYRNRLYGSWGLVDVEDALAALRHAADLGLIDGKRAVITGASAGGFTTLAALTSSTAFAAGINIFGVSDLASLCAATHKFERYYVQRLIGDNSDAELQLRSPIEHIDRLSVPLLTLQGTEDKIVPPSQAHVIVAALRARGAPCAYLEFAGEGHGFRNAETLSRVLEASLSFCAQVFNLPISENITPLEIENLHGQRAP